MFLRLARGLPTRCAVREIQYNPITAHNFPCRIMYSRARSRSKPLFRRKFSKLAKTYPVAMAGTTISIRYIVGDAVTQLLLQNKRLEEYDYSRTFLFAVFGFSFATTSGYLAYNVVYPMLRWTPLTTAVCDVFVHMPIVYFPLYYAYREFVFTDSKLWVTETAIIANRGLEKYKESLIDDVMMGAKFWIPAHYINFRYIPLHYRQPFIGGVGFIWAIILSSFRGEFQNSANQDSGATNITTTTSEPC